MNLSRTFWGVLAAVLAATLVMVIQSARTPPPGHVNVPKLMGAIQRYQQQLRQAGTPIPLEVRLEELLAQGLLNPEDCSGFAGMKLTVNLHVNATNLQQVLVRARMSDGTEIVALNDGSVQQR
jgi:hypothetical protein